MKQTLFTILLLASPALIAQGPADIANHTVRIQMTGAQVARSAMYQPETLPWHTWKEITDFVIDFPASASFTTTAIIRTRVQEKLMSNWKVRI